MTLEDRLNYQPLPEPFAKARKLHDPSLMVSLKHADDLPSLIVR